MLHCPYCGNYVKEEELYCIHCGKQLPDDLNNRRNNSKTPSPKSWLFPLTVLLSTLFIIGISYFWLESKISHAKELYIDGEEKLLEGDYNSAKNLFAEALEHHPNFEQAAVAMEFANKALQIANRLEQAEKHIEKQQYKDAIDIAAQGENELKNYNGRAVSALIDHIKEKHHEFKIAHLNHLLNDETSIDDLKVLLWEAENIGTKAEDITASIRQQIVDYTFSKASELLNEKQFNDALLIVEDGLKFAPSSEKLLSLKTTIDKEKVAFETAQQERIEQALTIAEEESKRNETDAVELLNVELGKDKQNNLIVKGAVKSTATVPIHSILIEYEIVTEKGKQILTNEVFVYPDTIYPDEKGNFEFTHYEMDGNPSKWKVHVKKIKWYTY